MMKQNLAQTLGFIGCGHMGGAMAERLLAKGHRLVVADPDPAACARLEQRGAIVVRTPRAVADAATTVFACLPSITVSHDVATGANGVIEGRAIEVYVECSTLGRVAVNRIANALDGRIRFADMPVSGGPAWAAEGQLTAILAAAPDVKRRLAPILSDLAKQVFDVGDSPGLAQIAKLVNNAISISGMIIACEAIVMGVKGGVQADRLLEVINASTGRNSATIDKIPRAVLPRTFDYGGTLAIGVKDFELYLELGRALKMPTLVGSQMSAIWNMIVADGGPGQDYSEVVRPFERWAGVEVRGAAADKAAEGQPSEGT